MTSNYERGRNREYRVRDKLLAEGWEVVVRSAGSHSQFDLIAFRPPRLEHDGIKNGEILLVQCKVGKGAERERKRALEEMLRFEGQYSVSVRAD